MFSHSLYICNISESRYLHRLGMHHCYSMCLQMRKNSKVYKLVPNAIYRLRLRETTRDQCGCFTLAKDEIPNRSSVLLVRLWGGFYNVT